MIFSKNDKIIFLGDSLTCRTGVTASAFPARKFQFDYSGSYVDILLQKILVHYPKLEIEAYNKGQGGNTVVDLIARVQQDVLDLHPNWVVLSVGANDCKKYSKDEFKLNLVQLLDLVKEKNIKVVHLSTTPANDNEQKNEILREYDEIIRDLCNHYGNIYIDLKVKFMKVMEYNRTAKFPIVLFNGGPHMSYLGNLLIADTIFEFL